MKRCEAKTVKGAPCQGGAMKGQRYCGPHMGKAAAQRKALARSYAEKPRPTIVEAEHTTFNCWCRKTGVCPICGAVVHKAGKLYSVH